MPRKKKSLRNPNAISSDPETVNRILREIEFRDDEREYEREYDYRMTGGLRSRRYRNEARSTNADHPYNGGLPGLGKRNR